MIARFLEKNEKFRVSCKESFVKEVIHTYRLYYRKALLHPTKTARFDFELFERLRCLLKNVGYKNVNSLSVSNVERKLNEELKRRGYYSLFGTVKPFRSLLVWSNQSSRSFQVSLPEKTQKVEVVFMEDFSELSWLHYGETGI